MMKRWRVGSLSMGLILVASGVIMLVSLIVRVNVLNVLLTFWPVILISLGLEILLHLFIKKESDGDGKLRYDGLSVLFISFLLVISIGFYAVTYYTGLFETRADMYAAFGIMNETVYAKDSTVLSGTKELAVLGGINKVTVLAAADGRLKVEYSVSVSTSDKVYAEDILESAVKIQPGQRAYLRSDLTMFQSSRKMGWPVIDCVIYLPPDVALDISQFWGSLICDSAIEGQIVRD